jgi:hypothetical protein
MCQVRRRDGDDIARLADEHRLAGKSRVRRISLSSGSVAETNLSRAKVCTLSRGGSAKLQLPSAPSTSCNSAWYARSTLDTHPARGIAWS